MAGNLAGYLDDLRRDVYIMRWTQLLRCFPFAYDHALQIHLECLSSVQKVLNLEQYIYNTSPTQTHKKSILISVINEQ